MRRNNPQVLDGLSDRLLGRPKVATRWRRGSLTLWIEDGALDHWQTLGPGGQARYADVTIQTTLMVRTAFKLALRQTEGLLTSVIILMDLRG